MNLYWISTLPSSFSTSARSLYAQLSAASIQGRVALGPKRGAPVERRGRRRRPDQPLFLSGELCFDIDGFSLHAKVALDADDREGLERLYRTIARPPLKVERLSLAPDGKVVYALRRHWRDGASAIAFEPLDFIARLAAGSPSNRSAGSIRCAARSGAYLPRPRAHLLTYHGVLAPAAQGRDCSVPGAGRSTSKAACVASSTGAVASTDPHEEAEPKTRKNRSTWAELMKRTFAIDVLICDPLGGPRRLIALLTDGLVIRKILTRLGLDTEPPPSRPRGRQPNFNLPSSSALSSLRSCFSALPFPAPSKFQHAPATRIPRSIPRAHARGNGTFVPAVAA